MDSKPKYSYMNADPAVYDILKKYARNNRKNQTEAEDALWRAIRGKALGVLFNRQYIIGEYITDFTCLEAKLVIEIDGGYHSEPIQQESDALRQQWLEKQGFRVLRFKNEEVLFNTEKVINLIQTIISNKPSPSFYGGSGRISLL